MRQLGHSRTRLHVFPPTDISPLPLRRIITANDFYVAWVRSGRCPGDGPGEATRPTARLQLSFLEVLDRMPPLPLPDRYCRQRSPSPGAVHTSTRRSAALSASVRASPLPLPPLLPSVATSSSLPSAAGAAAGAATRSVDQEQLGSAELPVTRYRAGARVPATRPPGSPAADETRAQPAGTVRPLPAVSEGADAARTQRDSQSLKRRKPHTAATWVDSDIKCGQCWRPVSGHEDALLCDAPECTNWLVCSSCVTAAGVGMSQGQAVPLLCPAHQIAVFLKQLEVKAGLECALAHKPETVGRFLGIITAFVTGTKMSVVLAQAPLIVLPDAIPEALRADAAGAEDPLWDQPRRDRLKGVAFKLLWLASKLSALDISVSFIGLIAQAYCRHRLSDDRPPGWQKCGAKHVATELGGISRCATDLGVMSVGPCLGAKRCLEARGAFTPCEHSPKYPLIPATLFRFIDAEPRPRSAKVQQALDALEWNAFWGLRPMYLEAVTRAHYTPHNRGFICKWVHATKAKRGDRTAGALAVLPSAQISAARHPRLTRLYNAMPTSGTPFAGYRKEATALLFKWFPDIPDGFVLAVSASRNGVDMAMLGLGVSQEDVDAHLWWARHQRTMRGYYAGLNTAIAMHATELFELVHIRPIAPGWYDKVSMPPAVDWAKVQAYPEALITAMPATAIQPVGRDDPDDIGPLPCAAPKGVPPVKARIRHGKA